MATGPGPDSTTQKEPDSTRDEQPPRSRWAKTWRFIKSVAKAASGGTWTLLAYVFRLVVLSPWAALTILGVMLVSAVLLRFVGFDALSVIPFATRMPDTVPLPAFAQSGLWLGDADSIRTCISDARKAHRPYVIVSVAQHVRLEDNADRTSRHASERISYLLLTLRNISKDEDVFKEQYQGSDRGAAPVRWNGPRIEEDEVGVPGAYQVRIDAKAGTLITVLTGVERDFRLPLKSISAANYNLGPGEDFWDYPNAENDVVCELTLTVESSNLLLKPVRAWQSHTKPAPPTMLSQSDLNSSIGYMRSATASVFSGTWHLIEKDDVAVVVFREVEPR